MKLPHSEISEQVVLHHLLNNNDNAKVDVLDFTPQELFFTDANKAILIKLVADIGAGTDYDLFSITEYLSDNKYFKEAGGLEYLKRLSSDEFAGNYKTHFDIIKEKAYHRQYAELSSQTALNIVQNKSELVGSRLREYESKLFTLNELFSDRKRGLKKANTVSDTVLADINTVMGLRGKYTGLPTGFQLLDEKTLGLHSTDLTVIAARVSCGKSSFAGSIIDNILESDGGIGKNILLFSLEMSDSQLVQRLISAVARVPLYNIRRGKMTQFEWARFMYAFDLVTSSNLYIDDTAGITIPNLEARIQAHAANNHIDLVVVDYLQLMTPIKTTDNRANDIASITYGMKGIAKKYHIPLISLSQLSRTPEKRVDHRPVISDLRDSGRIEADADNVWFLYRDELYNPTTDNKGMAEVIIAKQRQGELGTIPLAFVGPLTKFMNLIPE